jgi:rhomboid protease GluP
MLAELPDERVDFERGMSYAPPATLAVIAVLVLVFVWQITSGALGSREAIVAAGALVRERVLAGELWRLGSATLLHGSVGHLLGNCMALYIVGMAGEHALGARRALAVYIASAIAGSVASVLSGPGPSVGASGAIFGLLGAVILILFRYRHVYHVRDKRIGIVLAGWAGYIILTGLVDPMIDNAAHLGGLLGGALAAALMRPRLPAVPDA